MKYFFFLLIFIKLCLNQIVEKNINNAKEEDNQKNEIKKLEIKYSVLNDTDIQIIESEQNTKDEKFILNEQTYIIYPSNNKEIEQYSLLLSGYIKNNTGINIGVTPNLAMKMTNKIKNNFIQLIKEKKNNENENIIINIKINHRKILMKSKDLIGINRGINIIKQLLIGNNKLNNTYDEIHFGPKQILANTNIKNNQYIYYGLLISFILILITICITKSNHL